MQTDRHQETVWRFATGFYPSKSLVVAPFKPSCGVPNKQVQDLVRVRGWSVEAVKFWSMGSNRHLATGKGMRESKNAYYR